MLQLQKYTEQTVHWPRSGRHILAQFDEQTIVVYQAYNRAIGQHVIQHGSFGGDFNFERMTWVKTNFLWMMYRSAWGTKEDQEITLGLRLRREFFDSILAAAVPSSWEPAIYPSEQEWSAAGSRASVRLQWDPDHDPAGAKLQRRAIQLGLRRDVLEAFAQKELLEVIDLSDFVAEQRARISARGWATLQTPTERPYRPSDPAIASRVRLGH
jgi:hypothetical protein